jgi:hypothetical protein
MQGCSSVDLRLYSQEVVGEEMFYKINNLEDGVFSETRTLSASQKARIESKIIKELLETLPEGTYIVEVNCDINIHVQTKDPSLCEPEKTWTVEVPITFSEMNLQTATLEVEKVTHEQMGKGIKEACDKIIQEKAKETTELPNDS